LKTLQKFALLLLICFSPLATTFSLADDINLNPYMVIDISDGSIISAHREFDRWYPASLTKLMTAYVTMKAIRNGELKIGSPVRISKRARNTPPSRMGYKIGTKLRIDTSLKILIVKSANDVAVALAEAVAGSVESFVVRMNQNAKFLGLTASKFVNPNGLHSSAQYSSARDLAILSRRIFLDFPQYSHWFSTPALSASKKIHYSYNLLLERFDGANGMKTGFVCASGYNMVASAKRKNRQLIAVILGEKSQADRTVLAARLLNEAFANPKLVIGNILTSGDKIGAEPVNQRSLLCSQEAIKSRYEPAAGKAIIKSPELNTRKISQKPTKIHTGGVDSDPSKAYALLNPKTLAKIMVPTKRPKYKPKIVLVNTTSPVNLPATNIPVPILRPSH
jgi:D-alanyl-D-alanine carboxypeptidase